MPDNGPRLCLGRVPSLQSHGGGVTLFLMRPIRLFPLVSALLVGLALAQEPAKAPRLKLISLTGSIEVESGGKKTVFNGTDLPPGFAVELGSRVRILSGSAVFSDGKMALSAPAGADFRIQAHAALEGAARSSPSFELALSKTSAKIELAFEGKTAMLAPDSAVLVGQTPGGKAEVSAFRGELNIPGVSAPPAQSGRKEGPPPEKTSGTNDSAKQPEGDIPFMPMEYRPPPSSPWPDLLAPKAPACNLTCAACWTLNTATCQCIAELRELCIATHSWDPSTCQCVPIDPFPPCYPLTCDIISESPVVSPSAP